MRNVKSMLGDCMGEGSISFPHLNFIAATELATMFLCIVG